MLRMSSVQRSRSLHAYRHCRNLSGRRRDHVRNLLQRVAGVILRQAAPDELCDSARVLRMADELRDEAQRGVVRV